jgi:hypothetical protein
MGQQVMICRTGPSVTPSPSYAARIAIRVARQLAWAARKSHPGDGALAPPPIEVGMSVAIENPSGLRTVTARPLVKTAVAALSV